MTRVKLSLCMACGWIALAVVVWAWACGVSRLPDWVTQWPDSTNDVQPVRLSLVAQEMACEARTMLTRDECVALTKQEAQRLMQRFSAATGSDTPPLLRYPSWGIPSDGRQMWWIAGDSHEQVPRVTRCLGGDRSEQDYDLLWLDGLRLFLVEAFPEEAEPLRPFLTRAVQERDVPPAMRLKRLCVELARDDLLVSYAVDEQHQVSELENVPVLVFLASKPARVWVSLSWSAACGQGTGAGVGCLIAVLGAAFGVYCSIKNTKGPRERAFMNRTAVRFCVGAILFLAILLALVSALPDSHPHFGHFFSLTLVPGLVIAIVECNRRQTQIRQDEAGGADGRDDASQQQSSTNC